MHTLIRTCKLEKNDQINKHACTTIQKGRVVIEWSLDKYFKKIFLKTSFKKLDKAENFLAWNIYEQQW